MTTLENTSAVADAPAAAAAPAVTKIGVSRGIVLTVQRTPGLTRTSKYPWDELDEVGTGFAVPEGINLKGFRTLAQKAGAARGKVFSVGRNLADGGKYYCVLKAFRPVAAADVAKAVAAEHAAEDALHGDAGDAGDAEAAETANVVTGEGATAPVEAETAEAVDNF